MKNEVMNRHWTNKFRRKKETNEWNNRERSELHLECGYLWVCECKYYFFYMQNKLAWRQTIKNILWIFLFGKYIVSWIYEMVFFFLHYVWTYLPLLLLVQSLKDRFKAIELSPMLDTNSFIMKFFRNKTPNSIININ